MILDTSAILAIIFREATWAELLAAILNQPMVGVGAPTLVETAMVLTSRLGVNAKTELAEMLSDLGVDTIPFQQAHWMVAVEAFERFGKGRHPAALNFGDCLTYSIARLSGRPLLAVGDDFRRTDLELAP